MTCKPIHSITFTFNIMIHMLILFTILTGLYFYYIYGITKKHFENQVNDIIEHNISSGIGNLDLKSKIVIENTLPPVKIERFKEYLQNPKYSYVTEHNNWMKFIAFENIFIFFTLICILYLSLQYICGICIPMGTLIIENIITFIFVAIAEGVFFLKVASKFIPAPPSLIGNTVTDTFKKELS